MTNPQVGVGVFIFHQGRVLLGKRLNAHGAGLWGLTIAPSARIEKADYSQDFFSENDSHYITLYFHVRLIDCDGEVQNLEPNKKESWEWFSRENFPPHSETFCKTYDIFMNNKWMWDG
jgi:8-oxo-dGTP diphosphatase